MNGGGLWCPRAFRSPEFSNYHQNYEGTVTFLRNCTLQTKQNPCAAVTTTTTTRGCFFFSNASPFFFPLPLNFGPPNVERKGHEATKESASNQVKINNRECVVIVLLK